MLVNAATGTVEFEAGDGGRVSLPCELLTAADMVLQARYHAFLQHHDYRRELVCRRCKAPLELDHQVVEGERAWEMLTHCACRAMYGKIPWSHIQHLEKPT